MESSLGFLSSDFERLDTSTFNVGIYLSFSSFQMEHLVDLCCDDLNLVVDVLDTFCIQGRRRLDSLENAVEQENLSTAVFDAMFILGASKNIGAKPLAGAVDTVLDFIRVIAKRECLSDNPHTLCFAPCADASERASWQCALVTAGRAVRRCFDQLDVDVRHAIASLSHYLMVRKEAGGARSAFPELDMAYSQAARQAGLDPTLRRARSAPAANMHPAHHRRPSEPALVMISGFTSLRRLSLPALRINVGT
jgi:hypothetical protein